MKCLFLALEGFTSAVLADARAGGQLPSLELLASAGLLTELSFPLADARVAMLVSAMTGTWPDQHGILLAETSEDGGDSLRPVDATDRAQPALWEPLDAHGIGSVSVGWPVSITGQTARAAIVSAGFGHSPTLGFTPKLAGLVHPEGLERDLAECWLRPEELDSATLAPLVPRCREVNQAVDNRLAALATALAENVSRHAAFLALLDAQPWQFATLCLSLPAELDSLERASAPLADDLLNGLCGRAWPLLDAFLAEIFARIPAGCNVVVTGLPHPETPATPGFVILSGKGFLPSATVRGVTVLDLAPLIWRACGFQSAGMPGSGLLPALQPAHPQRVFSIAWTPPLGHRPRNYGRLLEVRAPILKKEGESVQPGELWHYSSLSVLGRSLMARDEWLQALPVLDAVTRLAPNDWPARCQLSGCQRLLGLHADALDTIYAAVHPQFGTDPTPLLLAAELEVLTGHPGTARKLLDQAAPQLPGTPGTSLLHAKALIALREWQQAAAVLALAVRATPREAAAHLLLARCHLAQRHWQDAFDCALQAGNLDASNPLTHEILGHALLGMGMDDQAWKAFEAATAVRPRWPRPWAKLAMLARRRGKPEEEIARLTAHYRKLKQEADERRQARFDSALGTLRDPEADRSVNAVAGRVTRFC